MSSKRKSVSDIKTINSARVGRRNKQTYLQLHTLSNRRKRLKDELERLKIRRKKAEKRLTEVQDQMEILLEKSDDVKGQAEVKSKAEKNNGNNLNY